MALPKGRAKGQLNRIPKATAEFVLAVFEAMGGVKAMTEWANENKTLFYCHLLPKLLPRNPVAAHTEGSSLAQLNVINVISPQDAFTQLEKLQDANDASDASSAGGEDSQLRPLDPEFPPYSLVVSPLDAGDAGVSKTESVPDAAAPRQDGDGGADVPVSLPHDVPAA